MSIKLIAVDIDGTLVNSQKEITPEVFSAIQDAKEAGVKVVIATGRPIAGVAKLLDDLQLRDQGDKEIVKCMFIDEPEILDAAIEKIPAEFYEHYSINKSAPFYLELLKKNVDKGSAITHLAEKLGLTKDETMAIGDEENDRAMLEVVGNPVVMENGNPEIKKIAKYTTKTNDESGVAHAIRTWVL